jgi:predicted porin
MDYFYFSSQYGSFTPGLQNAYAGGYVRPFKGFQVGAAYHYMAMATKLQDMNMTLGHEIELSASYKFSKDVQLMAGYSYMTGTKTMERLKRASDSGKLRWGWLALVVSPRIFTSK